MRCRAKRDRYVARGVSIAPIFAAHAHGAHLTDVDGREYIDFGGGIGVLNLGHAPTRSWPRSASRPSS